MNAPVSHAALATFGSDLSLPAGQETSTAAIVATARAQIELRYLMAIRYPRVWDVVRQELLKECQRPVFANSKRTYYIKPVGDDVHGLGIGFAEAAIRCMRNVSVEIRCIYDSPELEINRVIVTDLESNIPYDCDVKVEKTVERSRPDDDGSFFSVRKNSKNRDVFTVRAREDDLLNKRSALISKGMRSQTLRLMPQWLKEECIDAIFSVRENAAAKDPDAEKRRILDAFASIGVKAADLMAYLGHDIAQCSPAELVKLRGMWDAIDTGECTWATYVSARDGNDDGAGTGGSAPASAQRQAPARPMSKSAQAGTQAPTGNVDQTAGESRQTATPAPNPAATPAPTPTPAADTSPACSEGSRKFLLKKFAAYPEKLLPALNAAGFTALNGADATRIQQAIEKCDASALEGLTEDQFTTVKSQLPRP